MQLNSQTTNLNILKINISCTMSQFIKLFHDGDTEIVNIYFTNLN